MRSNYSRFRILAWFGVAALALLGTAVAAYGITADGDLSDIRSFSSPDAPAPIELADPLGFTDEPILASQAGGVSPSGFNIGSIVLAYDPSADAYYIGIDVSPAPADDPKNSNGSGAWDGDGDGDPDILTDGLTMTPPILYDSPVPLSGLTDKYTCALDIGADSVNDLLLKLEDSGSGPVLTLTGPGCLAPDAGWTVGDYAGNGPDVELTVANVSCLGLPECDYYNVRVTAFADTDADSAEESVILDFVFDIPLTICKVDAAGTPVPDWDFTVNGTPLTTGPDGCVTVFLPPEGFWEICETVPSDQELCGVTVDGETVAPVEVETGIWCIEVDADCHEVTWCNQPCTGSLEICKRDCEGTPIPGWFVEVTGPEPFVGSTGDDGCVRRGNLPIGVYTVCEELPAGWELCNPDVWPQCQTVEISCTEPDATVEFRNQPCTGTITVCKYLCDGTTPVSPWHITVMGPEPSTEIREGDTDGTGCITFTDLPVGNYWVCEQDLPAGWERCDGFPDCHLVTITCDDPEEYVEFRNRPCIGTITACKRDCAGGLLAGWTITLNLPDGTVVDSQTTDASGCVTFGPLDMGDYEVCETLQPGWELCDDVAWPLCQTVTLTCDDPEESVEFRNRPTGGPTRTPGYWFTHPCSMTHALEQVACTYITAENKFDLGCCELDINQANWVFWFGNRTLAPKVRRTLGMHIIAAMCNVCYLGTPAPPGDPGPTIIEDGIAVWCDADATAEEIGDVLEALDMFNNSGTWMDSPVLDGCNEAHPDCPCSPADPQYARSLGRGQSIDCW